MGAPGLGETGQGGQAELPGWLEARNAGKDLVMPRRVTQGEIRRRPTGVGDCRGFFFSFLLFFILLMFYPQQGLFYNQRKKTWRKGKVPTGFLVQQGATPPVAGPLNPADRLGDQLGCPSPSGPSCEMWAPWRLAGPR